MITANAYPLANQYFNQGVEKYAAVNFQGAIADVNNALEINPQLAPAYLNRGIAREVANDLEGACRDWRTAVNLGDKDSAEFWCSSVRDWFSNHRMS